MKKLFKTIKSFFVKDEFLVTYTVLTKSIW